MEILHKQESYDIIGACFEVYNVMGFGFYEEVYHDSLKEEFSARNIPHLHEPKLEIYYKDKLINRKYEPDFVCFSKIIIEIKAVKNLCEEHNAQVFNYLKATGFELGILVNFGSSNGIQYKRIVKSKNNS